MSATALNLLAATRPYVQRTRDRWQAARDDKWSGHSENEALIIAIQDADDLLRLVDELLAAIP